MDWLVRRRRLTLTLASTAPRSISPAWLGWSKSAGGLRTAQPATCVESSSNRRRGSRFRSLLARAAAAATGLGWAHARARPYRRNPSRGNGAEPGTVRDRPRRARGSASPPRGPARNVAEARRVETVGRPQKATRILTLRDATTVPRG